MRYQTTSLFTQSSRLDGMKLKVTSTVLPVESDSDAMLCLQSYQGLRIDKSLVY